MNIPLNNYWTQKLFKMPEQGMGFQRVDIVLNDNRVMRQVLVINSQILVLNGRSKSDQDLKVSEIKDITISMNAIVDLEGLHKELKLTDSQKQLLSDAIEKLLAVYGSLSRRGLPHDDYYGAVADGLNHAYKVVNGIDDDYNCLDK